MITETEQPEDVFYFRVENLELVFEEPTDEMPPLIEDNLVILDQPLEPEVPEVFLTQEEIMADPEMVAWYAWVEVMNAYMNAPTIEAQLAIVEPYQQEFA